MEKKNLGYLVHSEEAMSEIANRLAEKLGPMRAIEAIKAVGHGIALAMDFETACELLQAGKMVSENTFAQIKAEGEA
jgi:hypothetical protein